MTVKGVSKFAGVDWRMVKDAEIRYILGLLRKRVEAVKGISFDVRRGEVFGFLGPNGAGKTTTLKMLMGLVFPTAGRAEIFGLPVPSLAAKRRLGYLPESPYFYDYLTPEEFLDLAGALCYVPRAERRTRAARLMERVGLGHARGRPLRRFSKGMLQRVGIAQALMGDPELVVLDEPMTGLDPLGRKEIRDLILELRREGRTVFYSTHILSDVELTCDRVAMIFSGTRIAATYAAIGAVFGEWAGSDAGLGWQMLQAKGRLDTPLVFATVLIITAMAIGRASGEYGSIRTQVGESR
jgi:ABC-2 type transport system ATP-binding protein